METFLPGGISRVVALNDLVGVIRILFGLIFLAKLAVTYRARTLVWAHRRPLGIRSDAAFRVLLIAQIACVSAFTCGFLTAPMALASWLLYVVANRAASLYGLEDIVFQTLAFYFVFAGAGAALSLDSALGIETWGRLPAGSLAPELALCTAFGLLFLSAGVEKLKSPMWRAGLGAYYFFLIPQFRRVSTALFTRNRFVIRFINYSAMFFQLAMVPAFFFNAFPMGLISWSFAFSFAFSLSTVFVLTWIGEALVIGLLLVLWTLLNFAETGLAAGWVAEIGAASASAGGVFTLLLAASLIPSLWSVTVPSNSPKTQSGLLGRIHGALRIASRLSWGLAPAKVFTELHVRGPVVYRVFQRAELGEREVFPIFGPTCGPGSKRNFQPSFFEVTSYKVAEACMEIDRYGEVQNPDRRQFILKLADFIAETEIGKAAGPLTLRFKIVQILPPEDFAGADDWYLREKWVDAFDVAFEDGKAKEVRPLGRPLLRAATGRDLNRVSFAFNPHSH